MLAAFQFLAFSMNANSLETLNKNTTIEELNSENSNFTNAEEFTCTGISFASYKEHDPACGASDGAVRVYVNNPNNYCLVYRLYNYTTSSWHTGYQTSRVFKDLPAGQYRVKMYRDLNCDINNVSTTCYTASDYFYLDCQNLCSSTLTINNNGNDPARILWWLATGDQDKAVIQPGESWTTTTNDTYMWRAINTNTDWSNILYDEHFTVSGCSNQTWNISPNYTGASCTGEINSIQLTNGSESVTLQNGGTYQICDLPTNNYLEAVVSGNHESFHFIVDGYTRNENAIPYNYPIVSNGETWDPQVGTHNITGTLYSQDGSTGDACDQVSIQFNIVDCTNTNDCGTTSSYNVPLDVWTTQIYTVICNDDFASTTDASGYTDIVNFNDPIGNSSEKINSIKVTLNVSACDLNENTNSSYVSQIDYDYPIMINGYEIGKFDPIEVACALNTCSPNNVITYTIDPNSLPWNYGGSNQLDLNFKNSGHHVCVADVNLQINTSAGVDSDGDGLCDVDDCRPNDPNLPTTPGTSCNDNNNNTENDIIQGDGCTCAGTPVSTDCNNAPQIDGMMYIGTFDNSFYYKKPDGDVIYTEAKAFVESRGGHLPSINSAAENSFIANALGGGSAWIGLNDVASEGNFVWENGDPVTYTNWNTGEPNNYGTGEDYTEILSSGLWNDLPADAYKWAIMELPCSGAQTCTGNINSIILTNGTESVTLQNGGTYQSCNLPTNNYLEASVSGSHQSFKFTVDGVNRTENVEPYNFPAISNGVTWNPGVGTHTITGRLYSQDGLAGDLCDEINIQITIVECPPNPSIGLQGESFTTCKNEQVCNTVATNDDLTGLGTDPYSLTSGPSSGDLTFNADGTFCYSNSQPGTYSFTYQVTKLNLVETGNGGEICSGKVKDICAVYNGPNNATIAVYNKDYSVQIGELTNVQTGEVVCFHAGNNVSGGQAVEWQWLVNGQHNTSIHTSCSVSLLYHTFGDFYLTVYGDFQGNNNNYYEEVVCTATTTITIESCNGTVGDFVFNDVNGNGIQDNNEFGLPGITVMLLDADGNMVATTTTDQDGKYEFLDVEPGDYKVKFPSTGTAADLNYFLTLPNEGNNDDVDSDPVPMTGTTDAMTDVFTVNAGDEITDIDAGYYVGSALAGVAWEDTDEDGIQDPNEPLLEGVVVMLLDADGNMIDQTTTNDAGAYVFPDLPPGDYKVKFPVTNVTGGVNYELTDPNQGNDDNLDSDAVPMNDGSGNAMTQVVSVQNGETVDNLDAGYIAPASIGDYVFEDLDGDGIQDPNEIGIDGVTVMLLDANGNMITSTTTANGGFYEFPNLPVGDYKIKFTAPSQDGLTAVVTAPNQGGDDTSDSDAMPMNGSDDAMTSIITVGVGDNINDVDAGFYFPATIGNLVFEDENGNGIQDNGEPGIDGVTVILFDGNGAQIDATTTSNGGTYSFTNLAPGDYKVVFPTAPTVNGTDYDLTTPNAGGDDQVDSDAVPMTTGTDAMTQIVTLGSGDNNDSLDAGYFEPVKLGDKVFEDLNGNGIQDPNEPGIDGIIVMLLDADGNMITQTTTANGGLYEFDGLAPGDYKLKFTETVEIGAIDYVLTLPNQGGDDTSDSDAVPMNDGAGLAMTDIITLESGNDNLSGDAGYYIPASIGDYVFQDNDQDGIQDGDESGIDGVTVMLIDVNGTMVASTTTANGGFYEFSNLIPGDYQVKFTAPTVGGLTAILSDADQGGDDTLDSDAIAVSGTDDAITQVITIISGNDENDVDAGFFFPATLGDYVFEDLNANGIQEAGEPGVDGVTVTLLDANGDLVATTTTSNGGQYEFVIEEPGDYQVQFTAPTQNGVTAGFTTADQGGDDTLDSDAQPVTSTSNAITSLITVNDGDDINDVDAGIFFPVTIGNYVWLDADKDGVQDNNESGIEGVTVMLLDDNGDMVASTITDQDGLYLFTGIAPGSYQVKFPQVSTASNGDVISITSPDQINNDNKDSDAIPVPGTSDALSPVVTLTSGDSNLKIDAGYISGDASLGNYVFVDVNQNGIQDGDDYGLDGVTVILVDGAGSVVSQTTTTNGGFYEFTGLIAGDYKVVFPDAYTDGTDSFILTFDNNGGNETVDSDAVAMNDGSGAAMSQIVTLNSDDNIETIDAGFIELAKVGNYIFEDVNENGIQDADDLPFEGATVELSGTDIFGNTVLETTTSDINGNYLFDEVVPGSYIITVTSNDATFVATVKDANLDADDANDSDIDPATGASNLFTLNAGDDNQTIDAGFHYNTILPVALISFEAQLVNNNEVVLKWATASEEDNKHFIVERSADGRDFEAIGVVEGNGTSNVVNTYSLDDLDPFYGANYYRLKQVDYDGDYEYSQVETVVISGNDLPDVIVYPNPVVRSTTLRVVTPFEQDAQIEIVSQGGQIVKTVIIEAGANSKQLDLSGYAAGVYFAYINFNGHRTLVYNIVKVEE